MNFQQESWSTSQRTRRSPTDRFFGCWGCHVRRQQSNIHSLVLSKNLITWSVLCKFIVGLKDSFSSLHQTGYHQAGTVLQNLTKSSTSWLTNCSPEVSLSKFQ